MAHDDPELALWQLDYKGLLMGPGTHYHVTSPVDLFSAQTRTADVPIPRGHGSFPARDYLSARDVTLEMLVYAGAGRIVETTGALQTALRTLTIVGDEPDELQEHGWLRFHVTAGVYRMRCHPARWSAPIGPKEARSESRRLTVLFSMHDPMIYGDERHTALLTGDVPDPDAPGEGWELPVEDLPWDASGGQATGHVDVIDNLGWAIAYPKLTLYNGEAVTLSGFTIEEINSGQQVTVDSVIPPGSTFVMDFFNMQAGVGGDLVALDGANRYPDWVPPRIPFAIHPGTNLIEFIVMGPSGPIVAPNVTLAIDWYDTYG